MQFSASPVGNCLRARVVRKSQLVRRSRRLSKLFAFAFVRAVSTVVCQFVCPASAAYQELGNISAVNDAFNSNSANIGAAAIGVIPENGTEPVKTFNTSKTGPDGTYIPANYYVNVAVQSFNVTSYVVPAHACLFE